jgi:hypothetical protein
MGFLLDKLENKYLVPIFIVSIVLLILLVYYSIENPKSAGDAIMGIFVAGLVLFSVGFVSGTELFDRLAEEISTVRLVM